MSAASRPFTAKVVKKEKDVKKITRFKDKELSDSWTAFDNTLQEGLINARDALVAGTQQRYAWICEKEGCVTIRSCRTGSVLQRITKQHVFPWSLAQGPHKLYVWVGYSDGRIILYSSSPPYQECRTLECGANMGGCNSLLSHLHFVFAGYGNCQVVKWNGSTHEREGYFVGHTGGRGSAIRCMDMHLTTLFTSADDMCIRKWDVNSYQQLVAFKGHEASVLSICYTRKNHLWSGSEDNTVKVWNPENGSCLKTFRVDAPVSTLRFFGNRVWCGAWNRTLTLFDAINCERVGLFKKHQAPITDIVCVASTRIFKIWTVGADKCIHTWNMEGNEQDYEGEMKDIERQMFSLKSEVDSLNKELGRGPRVRANSCWEDDLGFCSTDIVKGLKSRLRKIEQEKDNLLASATERQQVLTSTWMQHIKKQDDDIRYRYFTKIFKFWAFAKRKFQKQYRTSLRRNKINQTFHLLMRMSVWKNWVSKKQLHNKQLNQSAVKSKLMRLNLRSTIRQRYFMKLLDFSHQNRSARITNRACQTFLRITTIGLIRISYLKLVNNVQFTSKIKSIKLQSALLSRIRPNGVLRIYFQTLRDNVPVSKRNRLRKELSSIACRLCAKGLHKAYLSKWRTWAEKTRKNRILVAAVGKTFAYGILRSFWRTWNEFLIIKKKSKRFDICGQVLQRHMTVGMLRHYYRKIQSYTTMKRIKNHVNARLGTMTSVQTDILRRRTYVRLLLYSCLSKKIKMHLVARRAMVSIYNKVRLHYYYTRLSGFSTIKKWKRNIKRRAYLFIKRSAIEATRRNCYQHLIRAVDKTREGYAFSRKEESDKNRAQLTHTVETINNENAALNQKVLELDHALKDINQFAMDGNLTARRWERRFVESSNQNTKLSLELQQVRSLAEEMRSTLKKHKLVTGARPFLLSNTQEVFKRILEAEFSVKACFDSISMRQPTKLSLMRDMNKIRDAITAIKKDQKRCIQWCFSEDEKLSANVSALLYGKQTRVKTGQQSRSPPNKSLSPDDSRVFSRASSNSIR